ncbi:hypothetical protein GCM10022403_080750 [Streptomyces coacervatus]|uniref:RmlD-like substrate binding domain-containing protein n=1 Tax=Streptomyces coacervatus TaxID=647381 RepID=A0ABP7J7S5_9ACTN
MRSPAGFGWLLVGAGGTPGRVVRALLETAGAETVTPGHRHLDITDRRAVSQAVATHRPRTVVNCPAWTDVDAAERDVSTAARLLHVSTDHVFGGDPEHRGTPNGQDALSKPRTAHGRTEPAAGRRPAADTADRRRPTGARCTAAGLPAPRPWRVALHGAITRGGTPAQHTGAAATGVG